MAMQAAKTTFETQRSPFSRSPFLLCCWRSKDDICRWRHVQKTPLWVLRLLKLLPEVTRAFQKYPFLLTEFLIYGRFWSQLPSKFRKFLQIHLLFGDGWFDRLHLVSFHSFARPEFLNASVSSKAWIIRIGFKEWFMSPKKASPGRVIYISFFRCQDECQNEKMVFAKHEFAFVGHYEERCPKSALGCWF